MEEENLFEYEGVSYPESSLREIYPEDFDKYVEQGVLTKVGGEELVDVEDTQEESFYEYEGVSYAESALREAYPDTFDEYVSQGVLTKVDGLGKQVAVEDSAAARDMDLVSEDGSLGFTGEVEKPKYIVDGKEVNRAYLNDNLYKSEFVDKLQEGTLDVEVFNDPKLEELLKRQAESGSQWGDKIEAFNSGLSTLASGVVGAPGFIVDVFEEITGVEAEIDAIDYLDELSEDLSKKAEELNNQQRAYKDDFIGSISEGNILDAVNIGFNTVANSAPIMVAAGLTGGAGGVAGALTSAATMSAIMIPAEYASTKISEDEKIKELSDGDKLTRAFLRGGAEGVFEGLMGPVGARSFSLFKDGVKNLVKTTAKESGAEAAKEVAEGMGKKTALEVFKTFGISTAGEGGSEALTALSQDLTDDYLGIQNLSVEEYMRNAAEAGTLGIFMGGVTTGALGGAGKVMSYLPLRNQKVYQGAKTEVREKQESGEINNEEAKQMDDAIESAKVALDKTDQSLSEENQEKVAKLIDERERIKLEIEGLDDNQVPVQNKKNRIDEINKEISEIGIEKPSTEEETGVPPTPEEPVSAETATAEVEKLRAEEQAEMLEQIPGAENALTDGKVDREKIATEEGKAKFDEIYNKYDEKISPLLEAAPAEVKVPEKFNNATISVAKGESINEVELEDSINEAYDYLSEIENDKSEDAEIMRSLVEDEIEKLENYDNITETQTRKIAEEKTVRTVKKTPRKTSPKREKDFVGKKATYSDNKGAGGRGSIIIQEGPDGRDYYVIEQANDAKVILGRRDKAFSDGVVNFDENNNPTSVTFPMSEGKQVTVKDPAIAQEFELEQMKQPEYDEQIFEETYIEFVGEEKVEVPKPKETTKAAPKTKAAPTEKVTAKERRRQEVERISKLPFIERIPALMKAGIIASNATYNLGKRFPVIVNISGVKVAFYRSSKGTGGKQKGIWTPMFGFGQSKGLPWLIKGDIETQVNTNYNSNAIQEYADILNKTLNWNHDLDKGQVKNHPFFKVLQLTENDKAFNDELYGIKDLGIINRESDVSGYINSKLQEINAKYDTELNDLEKPKSTKTPKTKKKLTGKTKVLEEYSETPKFKKEAEEKIEEDTRDEVESVVEEMNQIPDEVANFEVPSNLSTKEKSKLSSLVSRFSEKIKKLWKGGIIKDISEYNGIPFIFTISDQLSSGTKTNPFTGNTIDLKGGLGFTLTEGNEENGWANTEEDKADETVNFALEVYNKNKPLFDRLWKEGRLPYGHVPMAIVKMGQDSILSNEALFRVAADTIKTNFSEQERENSLGGLLEDIKDLAVTQENNKRKKKKQNPLTESEEKAIRDKVTSENDVIKFINDNKFTRIDQLLENINKLTPITKRVEVSSILFTGKVGKDTTPGKPTKKSALALVEGKSKDFYKYVHAQQLNNIIKEEATENIPKDHIIGITSVDVLNPNTEKINHQNYPFGPKGQMIGFLESPVHVADVFPEAYARAIAMAKEDKGGKLADPRMAVRQAVASSGAVATMKILRGAKLSDKIYDFQKLVAKLRAAFPSVVVVDSAQEFNNKLKDPNINKFVKDGDTVYGFTYDGKIFINPELKNLNTPLHEFGHIWLGFLKENNPALLEKGYKLLEGTELLKRKIEEFGDTELAREEAMAESIASRGEVLIDASKISKFKEWLSGVFNYLKKKIKGFESMSADEIQNMTLEQFVDKSLAAMLSGKEITSKQIKSIGLKFSKGGRSFTIDDVIKSSERENLTRKETIEVLQELGFTKEEIRKAMKPSPSVSKILKKPKGKKVSMSEKQALNKQIRDFARGVREAYKDQKNFKKKVNKLISDNFKLFGNLTPSKVIALTRRALEVSSSKPKSLDKFIDYAAKLEQMTEDNVRKDILKRVIRNIAPKKLKKTVGGVLKGKIANYEGKVLSSIRNAIKEDSVESLQNSIDELENKQAQGIKLSEKEIFLLQVAKISNNLLSGDLKKTLEAEAKIEALIKDGKSKYREDIQKRATEYERLVIESLPAITGGKKLTDQFGKLEQGAKRRPLTERIREKLSGFLDYGEGLRTLLDKIDRTAQRDESGYGGVLDKELYEPVADGRREKDSLDTSKINELSDKLTKLYGKKKKKALRDNQKPKNLGTFTDRKGNEVKLFLSQNQAYPLYQYMQDPSNMATFESMGFTDEMLQAVEDFLTPEIKEWADWQMSEFFPKYYDQINAVYKDMNDIDLPKQKIYVPIIRNLEGLNEKEVGVDEITFGDPQSTYKSLKQRQSSKAPFDMTKDGNEKLMEYTEGMNRYIAFAKPVKRLNVVFKNKDVRNAIREFNSTETLKAIDGFIEGIANNSSNLGQRIALLDKIRGNVTIASLALAPTVTIKQLTSIPAYASDIPISKFISGLGAFAKNPKKVHDILMESEYMQRRYKDGFERDLEGMKSDYDNMLKGTSNLKNKMMFLIKWGDKGAILMGGYSVYKYHFDKSRAEGKSIGESKKIALSKFEEATKLSQQSINIEDLSYFQRMGSLGKLFTMYMTSPMSYFRQERKSARDFVKGYKFKDKKLMRNAVKRFTIYHFVLPLVFQYVASGLPGLLTDWDEEDEKDLMRAASIGSLNGVFIAGQLISYFGDILTDKAWVRGGKFSPSPAFDAIVNIMNQSEDVISEWNKNPDKFSDDLMKEMIDLGFSVDVAVGLPVNRVKKLIENWKTIADDNDLETREEIALGLGFSPYVVTPKKKSKRTERFKKSTRQPKKSTRQSK